ncbi:MAG: tolB protein precursor [Myxococcaceae bacterium]|nr:tolB protein precursor [Myxococcaceae bacterium]
MRVWGAFFAAASLVAACESGTLAPGGDDRADGSVAPVDGGGVAGEVVRFAPGTPADAPDHFRRAGVTDPARAAVVDYPLDRVVFPRNVHPPDVQWEPVGAEGDVFRVRVAGASPLLTAFVAHRGAAFQHAYGFDPDAWAAMADRAGTRELTLSVDRWDAARNDVVNGSPVRLRFARGSIAGAVYYWTLGDFGGTQGRVLRVFQGTGGTPRPENFLPTPPARPDGNRCAACHGLSRDGNRLALSLGDGQFGGVYDVTTDLTGPDPTPVFRFTEGWFFAAFNPEGSRILMTDPGQRAFLLDGRTGERVPTPDGPLPAATHPAWAPDGRTVAYVSNANDAWNLSRGDLATMAVTGADRFGPPRVLHRGSDATAAPEGGIMDAYPSFSPDSRLIAFQHGTRVLLSASDAAGALYVLHADGSGAPVRLSNASGGPAGTDAWYPSFTPFVTPGADAGDTYWLLFYGRRDYGNALAGTRGTRRRQIWVSAVATAEGADPSSVPYWLPGQDVAQENASAFWAPRPCRPNSATCSADAQCCSGNCADELTSGQRVCRPPPPEGCRRRGQSCGSSGDCCDRTLECAGGVCLPTPG